MSFWSRQKPIKGNTAVQRAHPHWRSSTGGLSRDTLEDADAAKLRSGQQPRVRVRGSNTA